MFYLISFVILSLKSDMNIFKKEVNTFNIDKSKKGFHSFHETLTFGRIRWPFSFVNVDESI
jgi:hypothetical protein